MSTNKLSYHQKNLGKPYHMHTHTRPWSKVSAGKESLAFADFSQESAFTGVSSSVDYQITMQSNFNLSLWKIRNQAQDFLVFFSRWSHSVAMTRRSSQFFGTITSVTWDDTPQAFWGWQLWLQRLCHNTAQPWGPLPSPGRPAPASPWGGFYRGSFVGDWPCHGQSEAPIAAFNPAASPINAKLLS